MTMIPTRSGQPWVALGRTLSRQPTKARGSSHLLNTITAPQPRRRWAELQTLWPPSPGLQDVLVAVPATRQKTSAHRKPKVPAQHAQKVGIFPQSGASRCFVLLYPWPGRSVLTARQCGVSHSYPSRWNGNLLAPRCKRLQPQMKKRPGCSLPAGSFLFGGGNAVLPRHFAHFCSQNCRQPTGRNSAIPTAS
jgi:hypothetical protein